MSSTVEKQGQNATDAGSADEQHLTSTTAEEEDQTTEELSKTSQLMTCNKSIESNMNELFRTLRPFVHKLDDQVMQVNRTQQLLLDELNQLLMISNQIRYQQQQPVSSIAQPPEMATTNPDAPIYVYPKLMSSAEADISVDIEEKSRRLLGLKRRLTLVHSILQTVNTRVKKLLLAHDSRMLQMHQQQQQQQKSN